MRRGAYDRRVAALKSRYSYLFAGPHSDHCIAPGWLGLVEQLCAEIDGVLDEAEHPSVYFRQIKEKFGGLRAYLSVAPVRLDITAPGGRDLSFYLGTFRRPRPDDAIFERIEPFVSAAESKSRSICSFCGAPGELRRGRDRTLALCDRHTRSTTLHGA